MSVRVGYEGAVAHGKSASSWRVPSGEWIVGNAEHARDERMGVGRVESEGLRRQQRGRNVSTSGCVGYCVCY